MPNLPARIETPAEELTQHERQALWGGLTDKQRAWYVAYLQNGYNATAAVREAGYQCTTPAAERQMGHQNRHHPKISRLIADAFRAQVMDANEALARVGAIARSTVDDLLDTDADGNAVFDLQKARETGAVHHIKSIDITRTEDEDGAVSTTARITMYDKQKALDVILKAQGAFGDDETEGGVTNNFFGDINNQLLQSGG